jgi:hypothetical protein
VSIAQWPVEIHGGETGSGKAENVPHLKPPQARHNSLFVAHSLEGQAGVRVMFSVERPARCHCHQDFRP